MPHTGFEDRGRRQPSKRFQSLNTAVLDKTLEAAADGVSNEMSIESTLAAALMKATEAGQWPIVAQLAKELEARRLEGSNVIPLRNSKRRAE